MMPTSSYWEFSHFFQQEYAIKDVLTMILDKITHFVKRSNDLNLILFLKMYPNNSLKKSWLNYLYTSLSYTLNNTLLI